jgi:hypothetical protein
MVWVRPSEEAWMQVKGTMPWGGRGTSVEDEGIGVGGVREEVAAAHEGGWAGGGSGGVRIVAMDDDE